MNPITVHGSGCDELSIRQRKGFQCHLIFTEVQKGGTLKATQIQDRATQG